MSGKWPGDLSTAVGRWAGFGPYYAMFPLGFVKRVIDTYCPPDGAVLDPFCGRGSVPFVAKALGRQAVGVDLNPVAWIYSTVKTSPFQTPSIINMRLGNLARAVRQKDRKAENEFQAHAWSPEVLGFLNAARRELDWKGRSLDRTVMAFILVYLHAKEGGGLSNCMRQSKAMAPDYSVRWWKARRLSPPELDAEEFLRQRINWRYKYGTVPGPEVSVHLGDSRKVLKRSSAGPFDLLVTSPPYCDITNYRYDNWIRLWMLGGPALPDCSTAERYGNRVAYTDLLTGVFERASGRLSRKAVIYVRTDARSFTASATEDAVRAVWPHHSVSVRKNRPKGSTQTALFGDKAKKPGDIDIIARPTA